MKNPLHDHGYGIIWNDVFVEERERYKTTVTDFHEHDFYEINLILSGNIKVVVENMTVDGTTSKIVLTKPNASHFISCKPDMLYNSVFLVFSEEFIKTCDMDYIQLMSVFGEKGAIYTTTAEQTKTLADIIYSIDREEDLIRKKILTFYLFSYIGDISRNQPLCYQNIPPYIYEALTYINNHFNEKITAQELALHLHVGRTTLLTEFKKRTGNTLHEYIINCRLRNVIKLLLEGKNEYEAAICSGFSDSSSLIQCFKRVFKMTPYQYIKGENSYIIPKN